MASRIQRKLNDIEAGLVDSDDSYLSAENALLNWGAWTRSIPDPSPAADAKGSSLFRQMKQDYSDSDVEARIDPIVDEAELTEKLILMECSKRDIDMFRATYVFRLPREHVISYMRESGHRHVHKDNYRRFLDAGLARLTTMINQHWNIPSSTVIPKRGQSAKTMSDSEVFQVQVLGRSR